MPVLDLLCRDPRITKLTLVEPDIYKPHNVERHLFAPDNIGENKGDLAKTWLKKRRPDLEVRLLDCDLLDPRRQEELERVASEADLGICAADNEIAKYHWDALMRKHGKPWTLGEVLSGGIGGVFFLFFVGGAFFWCVGRYFCPPPPRGEAALSQYFHPPAPPS